MFKSLTSNILVKTEPLLIASTSGNNIIPIFNTSGNIISSGIDISTIVTNNNLTSTLALYLLLSGGTMTGDIGMLSGNNIGINLGGSNTSFLRFFDTELSIQSNGTGANIINIGADAGVTITSTHLGIQTIAGHGKIKSDLLTTVDRTYQLPNINGTFAMLSDIPSATTVSNGLTLTGSNIKFGGTLINDTLIDGAFNIIIGGNTLLTNYNINVSSEIFLTSVNGVIENTSIILVPQEIDITYNNSVDNIESALVLSESNVLIFFANSSSSGISTYLTINTLGLGISTTSLGYNSYLKSDNITSDRTYQLPDISGTFALISDIISNETTAGNGLTLTGNNISLGGNLTQITAIDGNYDFALGQLTPLNSFVATINTEIFLETTNGTDTSLLASFPTASQIAYSNTLTNVIVIIGAIATEASMSWTNSTTTTSIIKATASGINLSTNFVPVYATLNTTNLTVDRNYEFPNQSGTFALLSDIVGGTNGNGIIYDNLGKKSIDIYNRKNYDNSEILSLDYKNRSLNDEGGNPVFYWSSSGITLQSIAGIALTSSGNKAILKTDLLTASPRTYQFPDYNGTLAVDGDLQQITSTYLALITDEIIECTTGTFNLSLFPATGNAKKKLYIKNSGGGIITIIPNGVETIDGDANLVLVTGDGNLLISNGSNWIKL